MPGQSRRHLLLGFGAVALSTIAFRSQAAGPGRVAVTRKVLVERDKAWRLLVSIHLATTPPTAEVPLRFVFSQSVDYRPGNRRIAQKPPRELIETRSVDFRSLSGGIGREGRAELALARAKGFRAGDWTVQVEMASHPVGASVAIVLDGVNTDVVS